MNSQLLKNRPKDSSAADFEKAWDNSGYVLEALWKTIEQFAKENEKVSKSDFDCPNHYARLAYQAGMNNAYWTIISMLPQSAKPI